MFLRQQGSPFSQWRRNCCHFWLPGGTVSYFLLLRGLIFVANLFLLFQVSCYLCLQFPHTRYFSTSPCLRDVTSPPTLASPSRPPAGPSRPPSPHRRRLPAFLFGLLSPCSLGPIHPRLRFFLQARSCLPGPARPPQGPPDQTPLSSVCLSPVVLRRSVWHVWWLPCPWPQETP